MTADTRVEGSTPTGPARSDAPSGIPPYRYTAALAGEIERRWQDRWEAEGTFHTPNPSGPLAGEAPAAGEKFYLMDMFPYPSGSGLHVGHPLGFIGTGILAVPVLAASGSVAFAGLLNKSWGFARNPRQAPLFYALLIVGTLGGAGIAWFSTNPMGLLVLSAIINGISAGPFLIVTMLIAGNPAIMGPHRNRRSTAIVGWAITALMTIAGLLGLYVTVTGKG